MEYQDLVYFGYEWNGFSKTNETDFIDQIKIRFPDVKLNDAFDSIKGFRQEVYLPANNRDNYYAWLLAHGWAEASLTFQLMMMHPDKKEEIKRYINLAKDQYPQNLKTKLSET